MNLRSLFSGVDVSQADVDQIPRRQHRFDPGQSWNIWHLWQKDSGLRGRLLESGLEEDEGRYKSLQKQKHVLKLLRP